MSYPRFESQMLNYPGYDWEHKLVNTDDGYILTMFKLWKDSTDPDEKAPIFLQHGGGMDGTSWFEWNQAPAVPVPITLAD